MNLMGTSYEIELRKAMIKDAMASPVLAHKKFREIEEQRKDSTRIRKRALDRAMVHDALRDVGRWAKASEISDIMGGRFTSNRVSAHLQDLAGNGFIKRRREGMNYEGSSRWEYKAH